MRKEPAVLEAILNLAIGCRSIRTKTVCDSNIAYKTCYLPLPNNIDEKEFTHNAKSSHITFANGHECSCPTTASVKAIEKPATDIGASSKKF